MSIHSPDEQTHEAREQVTELLGIGVEDFRIAYISCPQDSGRNYLGGFLLTDYRTRPLEFSFVSPVKVTVMQKIIHGKTLEEAIVVDIIAHRLLSEATKKPNIIFVDSVLLLELQNLTKVPVAMLSRNSITTSSPSSIGTLKYLTSPGSNWESQVGTVIGALEMSVDLFDPFSRITEAIREGLKVASPGQGKV